MRFERARLELVGEVPEGTTRTAVLAAIARGLESTGRFTRVVTGRSQPEGAVRVLAAVETERERERRPGYAISYRVEGPDGALLIESPRDGFMYGFTGPDFLRRVELDVTLRLTDPESEEYATVASHRHYVAQNWKKAQDRDVGFAALDAFEASLGRNLEEEELAAVVAAARSPHKAVFDLGGELLGLLAARSEAARTAFRGLAVSKAGKHRLVAMAYLTQSLPRPFLVELLRLGLADKASDVVQKAAERCAAARLKELLPELLRAERAATREETREWVSLMKDITRDGYAVRPAGRGEYELTVMGADGGMSVQFVSKADLAPARLKRLVREALA